MIDFKLDSYGDIVFVPQEKPECLVIKFGISEFPRLKVDFQCRTRQKKTTPDALKIHFQCMPEDRSASIKAETVRNKKEKSQSIAIRLKTELGELAGFYNGFGSEINRLRHEELLNPENHELLKQYIIAAVKDIIPAEDVRIDIKRIIDTDRENTMGTETLKVIIGCDGADYSLVF